ncbi:MAG: DNA/RNA nuclease SfsA [Deltaproteobacteria bacterium]|nr:DNA/RNA nuclease SfsA [Deltaproteobacteria bacterium]
MKFETPLVTGTLVRRYKRFLADVTLCGGRMVTAHVPNTGSMLETALPGGRVALSRQQGNGRKLAWTWELALIGRTWVGVNTWRTNHIASEAITSGRIGPLRGYPCLRREIPAGASSRLDFLLERDADRCWVEVKNVTLARGRRALFPDAVTARGARHLRELMRIARHGERAVMLFVVNRADCTSMSPADEIDPHYARLLATAAGRGVELLAYRTRANLQEIAIDRKIPVRL